MTNRADSVIDKIDGLLAESDVSLSTRSGLRLMGEVFKDAIRMIGDADETRRTMTTRLINVETAINTFLEAQTARREKDEAERTKWRWVMITPIASYVVIELLKWIFR